MKCPRCNNEVSLHEKDCPVCGLALGNNEKATTSSRMIVVLIIMVVSMMVFSFISMFFFSAVDTSPSLTKEEVNNYSYVLKN